MKKKLTLSVLIALCIVLVLALLGVFYPVNSSENDEYADWMGTLSDNLYLSEINIPGSHDSAAEYIFPSYFLQTQDTGITEQLKMGVRYLDIRVELNGNGELMMCHSFGDARSGQFAWNSKLTLATVLKQVQDFLFVHPTETVLLCIKAENSDDDISEIEEAVHALTTGSLYYTENRMPQLGEVRGKAVILRRYEDVLEYEDEAGIDAIWEDQGNTEIADVPYVQDGSILVQDRYKYSASDKWEAITETMEADTSDTSYFTINFFSISYGKLPCPRKFAKKLNTRFIEYSLTKGEHYGILVFDFVNSDITSQVIRSN